MCIRDRYQHMKNLLNMRSTLSLTALKPKRYLTRKRSKKTLLEKGKRKPTVERHMEIERQNRILLNKMTSIVHGSFARMPYLKTSKCREIVVPSLKKSLNKEKRKKELHRINTANHVFVLFCYG
eukprot:TRINITY_DN6018_c0_g4_i3.p2 TRINITY_DN6018_c0_g4~~TRINITY_DN6018_c0_g4_i3.p2  ORF type:complete len:124 (+),score=38.36 TRINITY_DN6018_c0_g4_i3:73-444(+)